MEVAFLLTFFGLATLALLLYGLLYLQRSGCFNVVSVSVGRPEFYEMVVAYKVYRGDYKASGKPFESIVKIFPGIPCISAYYDDPDKVPAAECRYICGIQVCEGPDEIPDDDVMRRARENDFKVKKFPRVDFAVKASFPFTTSLSPMFGAIKTYPKLANYVKKRKLDVHPYLEICKENVIHYMAPLSKHAEFVVSEIDK